jgi:hypothetical protein
MALSKVNPNFVNVSQYGRRNLIINGAFQVWQRGTGGTGSGYSNADRWYTEPRAGTVVTHDLSTDVPSGLGFATSAHVYRSGGNNNGFHYNTSVELEGTGNYSKFAPGTKLVYSVYIKKDPASVQTIYNPYIYLSSGTGASNTSQAVYSNEGAGTITNNWQRMVFTFTCPTWTADTGSLSNVYALIIRGIMGTNDTSQNIYITGAQLELGDIVTPFEHRSFAEELQSCYRYYRVIGPYGDPFQSNGIGYFLGHTGSGMQGNENRVAIPYLETTMRTNPAVTHVNFLNGATGALVEFSSNTVRNQTGIWDVTTNGGGYAQFDGNFTNPVRYRAIFDAEL